MITKLQKSSDTIKDGNYLTRQDNVFKRMDEFKNFTYLFTWSDLAKFGLVFSYLFKSKLQTPKVLDIGCGVNDVFTLLKRNYITPYYIGIDYDEKVIQKLNRSHEKDILKPKFIQGDAFNINTLINEKFDFVLLLDIIEHVHDKHDGLETLKRSMSMLNDEGLTILTTPNNFQNRLQYPKYHDFEFSMKEIKEYIEENKWTLLETFGLDMKLSYNTVKDDSHAFTNVIGLRNVYYASLQPTVARQVMYVISKDKQKKLFS